MDDFDEYGGPPFDEEDKPKTVHVPYIPPWLARRRGVGILLSPHRNHRFTPIAQMARPLKRAVRAKAPENASSGTLDARLVR